MNKYEKLLEAASQECEVDENFPLKHHDGLYFNDSIALSNRLKTYKEKTCVLAEELGHHYTTVGNILDMKHAHNRKQERQARLWAYNEQIGLRGLVEAYKYGCRNRYEIAEYLEVTEEFLQDCIDCYRDKYGICTTVDCFYIVFIPSLMIGKII